MDMLEAMKARHSVRSYMEKTIPVEVVSQMQAEIDACNKESGLHIQLVTGEPKAFDGMMAHYGKFSGVQNYIALIGKKSGDLEEKLGYYGERIALRAQMLELNTCWVAMSFSKGMTKKSCEIRQGEKLVCVLSLGYGATQGIAHRSRPIEVLCKAEIPMSDWFKAGIEAALLAPTAINQQKFMLIQQGDAVLAKSTGGFYAKVDLGIVKYHFEVGAGTENFHWA